MPVLPDAAGNPNCMFEKCCQIKSFIILALLRQSVQRVCEAHLRVFAPGQNSCVRKNAAAAASHWQHCVQFDRPEI